MKHETPRTPDGAKLCAWCGGEIKQSGVGRSRDYCRRLCRDQAYKQRRDQRLIDAALADARPVSPAGETGFRQVAPPIPAPAVPEEDYLLAPPVPEVPVLPDAWKAPAPRRRALSRNRSAMSSSAMPLLFELGEDADGE